MMLQPSSTVETRESWIVASVALVVMMMASVKSLCLAALVCLCLLHLVPGCGRVFDTHCVLQLSAGSR